MKYITFAIPCYNSAEYMENAINSVLKAGKDIEVLIVNDGSTDDTQKIGERYAEQYPDIVRVLNKENGGHGDAVNMGLANAQGVYFKVVDSDDWLDEDALHKVMAAVKYFVDAGICVDMILANYVYDKVGVKHKRTIRYRNVLPVNRVFTWNEVGHFRMDQYILMHSVIYRTKMLQNCGLTLPKHTFYVDNIYVYYPLPFVEKMFYMDVDLYRYYIGREDQSVNEKVMIGRVDQQILVTRLMIAMHDLKKIENKKLRTYMKKYLTIMMTISSILCIRSGKEENLQKKKRLWASLYKKDAVLYRKIRHSIMGEVMNLPGKAGRKISSGAYLLANKVVGFN